jgi:hypothetical protein
LFSKNVEKQRIKMLARFMLMILSSMELGSRS